MVVENLPVPFGQWLPGAWNTYLAVLLLVSGGALAFFYLVSAIRLGPITGVVYVAKTVASGVWDLAHTSPRRTAALAWLAIKESIHRLVLVAFGVFAVILLFAGWYLDSSSANITELYLTFVMSFTGYLVLLLALFLSVFSLPNDIAQKTLHTIVTKVNQAHIGGGSAPVRAAIPWMYFFDRNDNLLAKVSPSGFDDGDVNRMLDEIHRVRPDVRIQHQ